MTEHNVVHNEKDQQFEITTDEGTALAAYSLPQSGDSIEFTHTEVPAALEGRGIGSALAKAAIGYAREKKLMIVPMCAFIAAYVKRHPELQEFVHPDFRNEA